MIEQMIQESIDDLEQLFMDIERLAEQNQKELDEIGEGGLANKSSRIVAHDDKYIYLYQHQAKKFDYFTYIPELYSLLATPSKCSFRVNSRGRTQIDLMEYYRAGRRFSPMANRFAYYYNEYCGRGLMDNDRFIREFHRINKLSNDQNIQIDHANNDIDNNCHWNLSAIPESANNRSAKGTLLAEIKPPYYCFIAVMPDGSYRIEFGYIAPMKGIGGIAGQRWFIQCQTIDYLNNFLSKVFSDFVAVEKLPPYLSEWGNPQYIRATYKDRELYFAGNFETTARAARRLLAMDAEQFVEWDGTFKWVTLLP